MMRQLLKFGVVGAVAAGVHWLAVCTLVPFNIDPRIANILAFLCAFPVSFLGHHHWTFTHTVHMRKTLPKFFAIACASFAVNETMYALLLKYTSLDYKIALMIVLVTVAVITFACSKFWAFKKKKPESGA